MKEYKDLTNDEDPSFTAGPVREDDFFEWEALITGPEGTPFVSGSRSETIGVSPLMLTCFAKLQEGGVFAAKLTFVSHTARLSISEANPKDHPRSATRLPFEPLQNDL
jgi:hypothetical protein